MIKDKNISLKTGAVIRMPATTIYILHWGLLPCSNAVILE